MRQFFDPRTKLGHNEIAFRRGIDLKIRNRIPPRMTVLHRVITRLVEQEVTIYGIKLKLLPRYAGITTSEVRSWEELYLSPSIQDGTVLDVGAGCGETAAFYLHWGAKKVIAIEPNLRAFELLVENAKCLQNRIECINRKFCASDLDTPHDFIKMDIDGGEVELLNYNGSLGHCIVEAHDSIVKGISYNLQKKFDLKIIQKFPNTNCLLLGK